MPVNHIEKAKEHESSIYHMSSFSTHLTPPTPKQLFVSNCFCNAFSPPPFKPLYLPIIYILKNFISHSLSLFLPPTLSLSLFSLASALSFYPRGWWGFERARHIQLPRSRLLVRTPSTLRQPFVMEKKVLVLCIALALLCSVALAQPFMEDGKEPTPFSFLFLLSRPYVRREGSISHSIVCERLKN